MSGITNNTFGVFGRAGLQLKVPANPKGIGRMITRPDTDLLIAGVRIEPYVVWPDDRGVFQELARTGQGMIDNFPYESTQISAALNYPGIIKAFHYHCEQTDLWVVVTGQLQVALVDLRIDSPTYGRRNTMFISPMRPWQVLIPPGIAHGYKVIGIDPSVLVYFTNRTYNPRDEGRLPYDDTGINYDWETQFK
jgi:dTDP-4-dehydrorhamnose 3,5-epimerase